MRTIDDINRYLDSTDDEADDEEDDDPELTWDDALDQTQGIDSHTTTISDETFYEEEPSWDDALDDADGIDSHTTTISDETFYDDTMDNIEGILSGGDESDPWTVDTDPDDDFDMDDHTVIGDGLDEPSGIRDRFSHGFTKGINRIRSGVGAEELDEDDMWSHIGGELDRHTDAPANIAGDAGLDRTEWALDEGGDLIIDESADALASILAGRDLETGEETDPDVWDYGIAAGDALSLGIGGALIGGTSRAGRGLTNGGLLGGIRSGGSDAAKATQTQLGKFTSSGTRGGSSIIPKVGGSSGSSGGMSTIRNLIPKSTKGKVGAGVAGSGAALTGGATLGGTGGLFDLGSDFDSEEDGIIFDGDGDGDEDAEDPFSDDDGGDSPSGSSEDPPISVGDRYQVSEEIEATDNAALWISVEAKVTETGAEVVEELGFNIVLGRDPWTVIEDTSGNTTEILPQNTVPHEPDAIYLPPHFDSREGAINALEAWASGDDTGGEETPDEWQEPVKMSEQMGWHLFRQSHRVEEKVQYFALAENTAGNTISLAPDGTPSDELHTYETEAELMEALQNYAEKAQTGDVGVGDRPTGAEPNPDGISKGGGGVSGAVKSATSSLANPVVLGAIALLAIGGYIIYKRRNE